jgi:hypothetical protein
MERRLRSKAVRYLRAAESWLGESEAGADR